MSYEFVFDCLLLAIVPWMLYFYWRKDLKAFWLTAVLAVSVKENMSLVLISLGFLSLFFKDRNKLQWSLIPMAAGALIFTLTVAVLMPAWRGLSYHAHLSRYDYLGDSMGEVIAALVLKPGQTWTIFTHPMNINFLMEMFSGLLLPGLAAPLFLLAGAPLFVLHLISTHYPEKLISYHYSHALVPFIFMAAWQCFAFMSRRWPKSVVRAALVGVLAVCLLQLNDYRRELADQLHYQDPAKAAAQWAMIGKIPRDAGVIATFEFMAALSLRQELYSFQKVYDKYYQDESFARQTPYYQKEKFTLPSSVEYALIDLDDEWIRSVLARKDVKSVEKLEQLFYKENWRLLERYGHTLLLQRRKEAPGQPADIIRLELQGRPVHIRIVP
jgi:uncharacterized membrane protein